MEKWRKRIEALFESLTASQWIAVAVARISCGAMFCGSGYRKLGNLDEFVELFVKLGIPFAEAQAPFVATLEFAGGALLLLGLGTRVFAALLSGTMVVAIVTERLASAGVKDLLDFLYLNEWLLLLILGWLVFSGGGHLSVDRILKERYSGS